MTETSSEGCGAGSIAGAVAWQLLRSLGRWLENQQTFGTLLVTDPGESRNAVDESNDSLIGGQDFPET